MSERYQRLQELGKGGVGTVYQGLHIPLQRTVAIKEIKDVFTLFGDVQKDDILQKFEVAVQKHASLVHANIIQILDIELDQQYPFFVMEHAPSGSLRERITNKEAMTLTEKLKCFVDIAKALQHAHHHNVLHTNLKPENVLFGHDGSAKVVDFGINRLMDRDDLSKQQIYIGVGTVAYLAPEQFRNPQNATLQSDIYSLGIIFYEMLTGKLPGRRSPMPSSFFPELPTKLDDVFDHMCMDAEEDRYESISQMLEDLFSDEEVQTLLGTSSTPVMPTPVAAALPVPTPPVAAPAAPVAAVAAPEPEVVAPESIVEAVKAKEEPSLSEDVASFIEEVSETPSVAAPEPEEEPAPDTDEPSDTPEASEEDGADNDILAKLNKYSQSFT